MNAAAQQRRVDDSVVPDDPRLVEAVRQYQAAWESGQRPDRQVFLNRHPDLAQAMALCFDGLDLVHGLGPASTRDAQQPATRSTEAEVNPEDPLGDFRLVREIGRGGMGIVFEAVQLSLGRRVAVKLLPFAAAFDARNLLRFKTEASAAAQLHHSNIVPVYFVGCERGVHFYAMQLIEGQSAAALIESLRREAGKFPGSPGYPATASRNTGEGSQKADRALRNGEGASAQSARNSASRVPPSAIDATRSELASLYSTQPSGRKREYFRAVARLGVQAARALDHAHEFGVVHRDIKPGNLLIDMRGNCWITDFGLAQFHAEAHVTGTGDLVGTLRYMSPEQAGGRRGVLDHRTDIYSLGATLYELLTLEPIFAEPSRAGLLNQILHEEPRPLRAVNAAIPVELETIVLKAVAKSPADRYASAGELANDLQRFLDDEPIRARRPSLWERMRKWARRHPAVVWAGVLIALLALVGLGINNWMVEAERAETERAYEREKLRAEEAENRFQQAKRSVDFIMQVCEHELADNPFMHGLRKKLLDFALAYYQDFQEQRRGDPQAEAELAAAESRVRDILAELALLQRATRFYLLNEPAVQEDMRLAEEQRQRLDQLAPPWPAGAFRFGPKPSDKRQQKFLEWARQRDKAINQVLKPQQLARLSQIAWQRKGPLAFADTEVVSRLKLTAEQQQKIQALLKTPPGSKAGEAPMGKDWGAYFEAHSQRTLELIQAVLSPPQRAQWQRLIGPPAPAPSSFFGVPGGKGPSKGSPKPLSS